MSPAIHTRAIRGANKPAVYIMVGLPDSGKSALAEKLKNRITGHAVIIASNVLRKKCQHKKSRHGRTAKNIFHEARKLIVSTLAEGHTVIFDATNIRGNSRRSMVQYIRSSDLAGKIISVFVDASLKSCIARYKKHNDHSYAKNQVERIKHMSKQLQRNCNNPLKTDSLSGFDAVHHYQKNGGDNYTIRIILPPQNIHPVHKQGKKAA